MALTVHHEARGEPFIGQVAVALVLRNRSEKYDTSVCWETFRHAQFSWTLHPSKLRALPAGKDWNEALRVARYVLSDSADFTGGATHYHLLGIRPHWAGSMKIVGQWGDHVFYRPRSQSVYNGGSLLRKCFRYDALGLRQREVPCATRKPVIQ